MSIFNSPNGLYSMPSAASTNNSPLKLSQRSPGNFAQANNAFNPKFQFHTRTQSIDWNSVLSLDLARIVRDKDLPLLQRKIKELTFAELKEEDIYLFDEFSAGQDSILSGALKNLFDNLFASLSNPAYNPTTNDLRLLLEARKNSISNFVHLFRLSQLMLESMLHVQKYLIHHLKQSNQAPTEEEKDNGSGISARFPGSSHKSNREKDLERLVVEKENEYKLELEFLHSRIRELEKNQKNSQKAIYLPLMYEKEPELNAGREEIAAQYPGEVFTCGVCHCAFTTPTFLRSHFKRAHGPHEKMNHESGIAPRKSHTAATEPQLDSVSVPVPSFSSQMENIKSELDRYLRDQMDRLESRTKYQAPQISSPKLSNEPMLAKIASLERTIADLSTRLRSTSNPPDERGTIFPQVRSPVATTTSIASRAMPTSPIRILGEPLSPISPLSRKLEPPSPKSPPPMAVELSVRRAASVPSVAPTTANTGVVTPRDRLRQTLENRSPAFTPFPEFPTLKARYHFSEWDPPSIPRQFAAIDHVVDSITHSPDAIDKLSKIQKPGPISASQLEKRLESIMASDPLYGTLKQASLQKKSELDNREAQLKEIEAHLDQKQPKSNPMAVSISMAKPASPIRAPSIPMQNPALQPAPALKPLDTSDASVNPFADSGFSPYSGLTPRDLTILAASLLTRLNRGAPSTAVSTPLNASQSILSVDIRSSVSTPTAPPPSLRVSSTPATPKNFSYLEYDYKDSLSNISEGSHEDISHSIASPPNFSPSASSPLPISNSPHAPPFSIANRPPSPSRQYFVGGHTFSLTNMQNQSFSGNQSMVAASPSSSSMSHLNSSSIQTPYSSIPANSSSLPSSANLPAAPIRTTIPLNPQASFSNYNSSTTNQLSFDDSLQIHDLHSAASTPARPTTTPQPYSAMPQAQKAQYKPPATLEDSMLVQDVSIMTTPSVSPIKTMLPAVLPSQTFGLANPFLDSAPASPQTTQAFGSYTPAPQPSTATFQSYAAPSTDIKPFIASPSVQTTTSNYQPAPMNVLDFSQDLDTSSTVIQPSRVQSLRDTLQKKNLQVYSPTNAPPKLSELKSNKSSYLDESLTTSDLDDLPVIPTTLDRPRTASRRPRATNTTFNPDVSSM